MKNFLFFLFLPFFVFAQGNPGETLADLRNIQPLETKRIFILGSQTPTDNLGGYYWWDASSSASEDSFNNVIISSLSTTGRWIKVNQRSQTLPHGVLVITGGVKTFYGSMTTDSNGTATMNLTTDGTSTGPSIFSSIFYNVSQAAAGATNPTSAIQSYVMTEDMKTTKHGYYKANAITLTLALVTGGILNNPVINIGAGQTVRFKVEGL